MNERIAQLQARQGWTDETIGKFALQWIAERDHEFSFTGYLEGIAAEEDSAITEDWGAIECLDYIREYDLPYDEPEETAEADLDEVRAIVRKHILGRMYSDLDTR